ncbi:hypothetical protein M422DRAFT_268022 [Sphaerobolus stellatus SS14]|uniref:Uncharacterized protein n=1 Tax=Sphaerobolus stellatus (strain SS14) TaxID=990650 RepID=A0A0C9UZF2_SPHS4|nr:hypothetical protein M422DRAFT_268022 [Sphaerobolus stellatus SS14]
MPSHLKSPKDLIANRPSVRPNLLDCLTMLPLPLFKGALPLSNIEGEGRSGPARPLGSSWESCPPQRMALEQYVKMCVKMDCKNVLAGEKGKQVADRLRPNIGNSQNADHCQQELMTNQQDIQSKLSAVLNDDCDTHKPDDAKKMFDRSKLPWFSRPEPILDPSIKETLDKKHFYLVNYKKSSMTSLGKQIVHPSWTAYGTMSLSEISSTLKKCTQDDILWKLTQSSSRALETLTSKFKGAGMQANQSRKFAPIWNGRSPSTQQKPPSSSFTPIVRKNLQLMRVSSLGNSQPPSQMNITVSLHSTKPLGKKQPELTIVPSQQFLASTHLALNSSTPLGLALPPTTLSANDAGMMSSPLPYVADTTGTTVLAHTAPWTSDKIDIQWKKPHYTRGFLWSAEEEPGTPSATSTIYAAALPSPPRSELTNKVALETISQNPHFFKIVMPINVTHLEMFLQSHPNQPYVQSVC